MGFVQRQQLPKKPPRRGFLAYCLLTLSVTLAAICRTKSALFDAFWCSFDWFWCSLAAGLHVSAIAAARGSGQDSSGQDSSGGQRRTFTRQRTHTESPPLPPPQRSAPRYSGAASAEGGAGRLPGNALRILGRGDTTMHATTAGGCHLRPPRRRGGRGTDY